MYAIGCAYTSVKSKTTWTLTGDSWVGISFRAWYMRYSGITNRMLERLGGI